MSSVRWTRGGRYIATTFRHVIPTLGLADGGLYTCEVKLREELSLASHWSIFVASYWLMTLASHWSIFVASDWFISAL